MSKELDKFISSKILTYLQKNCLGRAKAKKKDNLIRAINDCYGISLTDREIRLYIADTAEIGSHNSVGYFYIQDLEDLRLFQSEVHSRVKSLIEREKKAEESFYKRNGNQMAFEVI